MQITKVLKPLNIVLPLSSIARQLGIGCWLWQSTQLEDTDLFIYFNRQVSYQFVLLSMITVSTQSGSLERSVQCSLKPIYVSPRTALAPREAASSAVVSPGGGVTG